VSTNVVRLEIADQKAVVDAEFSGGRINTYELSLPCVIGAGRGLNTPKYPTFRDVMLSKKKEIQVIPAGDLKVPEPESKMEITLLEPLEQKREPLEIKGNTKTIAQKIVDILKTEAKVI
jgi:electron transfer flavoprotein beta subunit